MQISHEDRMKMVKVLAPIADPKHALGSNDCPLNLAVSCGSTDILKVLLKYFDPNVQDQRDFLPINVAICKHGERFLLLVSGTTMNTSVTHRCFSFMTF